MTTEQPTNDTEAREELLSHAHRLAVPAIMRFCEGASGVLTSLDYATVILGATAGLMAVHEGPQVAAAMLRSLADTLAAQPGATVN